MLYRLIIQHIMIILKHIIDEDWVKLGEELNHLAGDKLNGK